MRGFGLYLVILLVLLTAVSVVLGQTQTSTEAVKYSDVVGYFQNEQVTSFEMDNDTVKLKLKTGE